jgi:hypothetical protein
MTMSADVVRDRHDFVREFDLVRETEIDFVRDGEIPPQWTWLSSHFVREFDLVRETEIDFVRDGEIPPLWTQSSSSRDTDS